MSLVKINKAYTKPKLNFETSTSVWPVNELIARRTKFWKSITGEDGSTGSRAGAARKEETVYSGSYSIFPVPLAEWIYLRYAEPNNVKRVLDPFAGGPPRGLVAALLDFEYHGIDIRSEACDEDRAALGRLGLTANYHVGNGCDPRALFDKNSFDFMITCPPYYDLEVYSDTEGDISNLPTYDEFNDEMFHCAQGVYECLKEGSYACIVVGNFRNKKTGELNDFRGDTVFNFKDAGFVFWQDVILARPAGSAAVRASTSWKGQKLVPMHEYLLVFKKV